MQPRRRPREAGLDHRAETQTVVDEARSRIDRPSRGPSPVESVDNLWLEPPREREELTRSTNAQALAVAGLATSPVITVPFL